jgi:hypothetical protein
MNFNEAHQRAHQAQQTLDSEAGNTTSETPFGNVEGVDQRIPSQEGRVPHIIADAPGGDKIPLPGPSGSLVEKVKERRLLRASDPTSPEGFSMEGQSGGHPYEPVEHHQMANELHVGPCVRTLSEVLRAA